MNLYTIIFWATLLVSSRFITKIFLYDAFNKFKAGYRGLGTMLYILVVGTSSLVLSIFCLYQVLLGLAKLGGVL